MAWNEHSALESDVRLRPGGGQWICLLLVAVDGVAVDSWTKDRSRGLPLGSVRHVVGLLFFRHVENPGIQLGFLPAGRVVPIVVGLMIISLLGCFAAWGDIHPVFATACGLAVGGCAGNLLDRVPDGRVTDFVAFGRLPVFNLADVFILAGFAVMVGSSVVVDLRDEVRVPRPRPTEVDQLAVRSG